MSWDVANQALLAAEFARLARLVRDEPAGDRPAPLGHRPAAIDALAAMFALSRFERDVLLLVAGVEMDGALAAAAGEPGFALALSCLPDSHWSALSPDRPLRRWRLVEMDAGATLVTARLRIDERILHHLVGIDHRDARLAGLERPAHAVVLAPSQAALAARLDLHAPLLLAGDDADAMRGIALVCADAAGRTLIEVDADACPTTPAEIETLAMLLDREAMLSHAAILLAADDAMPAPALRLAARLTTPIILASREPAMLPGPARRAVVDKPDLAERAALWHAALPDPADAHAMAAAHRLGATAIRDAAASDDPHEQCRLAGRGRLDALATRVTEGACLDDLILPPGQRATLDAIVAQMRHRATVYLDWGMARGGGTGIAVLFAGESGTGKTMAAEGIATALGADLYRVDIARTVSKYIGETEKTLRRLFDAAEDAGAILLFDEADALFGKRSEVRDSHDRYANTQVGYLLQRIEQHPGLSILTTNMKGALDPAFHRRLRFVVDFPFPDRREREAIWRVALPPALPLADVDPARLAQLAVPGGMIRGIALNAAFAAAAAGTPVTMPHLLAAARAEAAKRDRALSDAETRGWA